MKKIYYLSTCDTCKRIIKKLDLPSTFLKQDIKKEEITVSQLEELHRLAGSYEALFSKRAKLYKERNLKNEQLTERDYKSLLLEHYTFLQRPVVVFDEQIFIGNSPKTVDAAYTAIHKQ
jgi:arsenate reductase-like glutaredoxin family protein